MLYSSFTSRSSTQPNPKVARRMVQLVKLDQCLEQLTTTTTTLQHFIPTLEELHPEAGSSTQTLIDQAKAYGIQPCTVDSTH